MNETREQRAAVARILKAGHLSDREGNRYYAEGAVVDDILAWHHERLAAEIQALQDKLDKWERGFLNRHPTCLFRCGLQETTT